MRLSCSCLAAFIALSFPGFTSGNPPQVTKAKTIRYLHSLESPTGGFVPALPEPKASVIAFPSLRATNGALRALRYLGASPKDEAACKQMIDLCHDQKSGGFADRPTADADVASTAIGVLLVVELKMDRTRYVPGALRYLSSRAKTFEEIRVAAAAYESAGELPAAETVAKWNQALEALRNPEGLYGKDKGVARDTGGVSVTKLRLGLKLADSLRVAEVLRAGQRKDGGFGKAESDTSDLESTYRVVRCFKMLGEKPNVDACKRFIASCENADGGFGVSPGQPSSAGGTYFATICLHWLEGGK